MDELYQAIEEKIKAAGYPREISGQAVYEDICDQIEGKENGSYVLLSKFEDEVKNCSFCMLVMVSTMAIYKHFVF